ncbi:folate family ECF transporter S component [Oribacterium sp. HCP28S3_H8]|uniref:folate family ECF transporter S component n=1 Tax=Oribacterium sp. HCP28S3_H8 TaxID=3438945 RepID=UPI003F89A1C2
MSHCWSQSLAELRRLRVVVFLGLMGALSIALEVVGSISFGPFVKIGITELPNVAVDYLFGPAAGGIFAAVMDILKYLAHPDGPFFPGFTISAMAGALIFGFILYRKKVSLKRLIAAEILVKLIVNIGLNTLWLNMLYHKAILVILPARIVSNLLQLPVDTLVIFVVLKAIDRTIKPAMQER